MRSADVIVPPDPAREAVQPGIDDALADVELIQHIAYAPAHVPADDVFDGVVRVAVQKALDVAHVVRNDGEKRVLVDDARIDGRRFDDDHGGAVHVPVVLIRAGRELVEHVDREDARLVLNEFYNKSKNKKYLILIIKTKNNKIFGGYTESGFVQDTSNNCFIFSLDKMKIYDYIKNNENSIICSIAKIPEFKNQILFENNNLKIGYTGVKKCGFLIEEDYELNDGKKMFEINKIQVISLNGLY